MTISNNPYKVFLLIFLGVLCAVNSFANETRMMWYPDICRDKIVFCYGGDIYVSNIDGKKVKQIAFKTRDCSFYQWR